MGYSRSPKTLESRLQTLGVLQELSECQWECDPRDESSLAYHIREALWIAANIVPDKYPRLAEAHRKFEIRISGGEGYVYARRRLGTPRVKSTEEPKAIETPKIAKRPITIEGPISLAGIIDQVKSYGTSGCPYHFPDGNLAVTELTKLYEWLQKQTTPEGEPQFLLFWAHPAVTIKEYDSSLVDFAFQPEDVQ